MLVLENNLEQSKHNSSEGSFLSMSVSFDKVLAFVQLNLIELPEILQEEKARPTRLPSLTGAAKVSRQQFQHNRTHSLSECDNKGEGWTRMLVHIHI